MRHSGSDLGLGRCPAQSPSFNEYSSGTMAEIAARVVTEFAPDTYPYNDDAVLFSFENDVVAEETKPESLEGHEEEEEDDSSFEFPVPGRGEDFSPVSADEIFNDGQIRPLFPIFNTDLVFADTDWRDEFDFSGGNFSIPSPAPVSGENPDSKSLEPVSFRLPLKKLMISERETSVTESASCSSSEADDLEGVAPESYCVWNPTKEEMRKKSKSTGSSRRWKIRDLLYRSNSDGADAFVPLPSKQQHSQKKAPASRNSVDRSSSGDGRKKQREADKTHTEHYMKSKATVESDRKRSYSPYSQDPVGFFAKMNGLSRTIQPF